MKHATDASLCWPISRYLISRFQYQCNLTGSLASQTFSFYSADCFLYWHTDRILKVIGVAEQKGSGLRDYLTGWGFN